MASRFVKLVLATIIIVVSGISMISIAYRAAEYLTTAPNERLELTKLMLTGILGTGTILAILEKIK